MLNALERLIYPMDKRGFFNNIAEKEFHFFGEVYQIGQNIDFIGDLNKFLSRMDIHYPAVRLSKNGESIPLNNYYRSIGEGPNKLSVLQNDIVFGLISDGATLTIQVGHTNMHEFLAYAEEFCRLLGCTVDLSVFWTPSNSSGLKAHYDTSSAFIYQISGEKRWKVYRPYLRLPISTQKFSYVSYEESELIFDVLLKEGQRLYIPRGWVHEPSTNEKQSIHITISLELPTWNEEFGIRSENIPTLNEYASERSFSRFKDALRHLMD